MKDKLCRQNTHVQCTFPENFSRMTHPAFAQAVFCKRAIESAEQDEQNIMQRFHEDQRLLAFVEFTESS